MSEKEEEPQQQPVDPLVSSPIKELVGFDPVEVEGVTTRSDSLRRVISQLSSEWDLETTGIAGCLQDAKIDEDAQSAGQDETEFAQHEDDIDEDSDDKEQDRDATSLPPEIKDETETKDIDDPDGASEIKVQSDPPKGIEKDHGSPGNGQPEEEHHDEENRSAAEDAADCTELVTKEVEEEEKIDPSQAEDESKVTQEDKVEKSAEESQVNSDSTNPTSSEDQKADQVAEGNDETPLKDTEVSSPTVSANKEEDLEKSTEAEEPHEQRPSLVSTPDTHDLDISKISFSSDSYRSGSSVLERSSSLACEMEMAMNVINNSTEDEVEVATSGCGESSDQRDEERMDTDENQKVPDDDVDDVDDLLKDSDDESLQSGVPQHLKRPSREELQADEAERGVGSENEDANENMPVEGDEEENEKPANTDSIGEKSQSSLGEESYSAAEARKLKKVRVRLERLSAEDHIKEVGDDIYQDTKEDETESSNTERPSRTTRSRLSKSGKSDEQPAAGRSNVKAADADARSGGRSPDGADKQAPDALPAADTIKRNVRRSGSKSSSVSRLSRSRFQSGSRLSGVGDKSDSPKDESSMDKNKSDSSTEEGKESSETETSDADACANETPTVKGITPLTGKASSESRLKLRKKTSASEVKSKNSKKPEETPDEGSSISTRRRDNSAKTPMSELKKKTRTQSELDNVVDQSSTQENNEDSKGNDDLGNTGRTSKNKIDKSTKHGTKKETDHLDGQTEHGKAKTPEDSAQPFEGKDDSVPTEATQDEKSVYDFEEAASTDPENVKTSEDDASKTKSSRLSRRSNLRSKVGNHASKSATSKGEAKEEAGETEEGQEESRRRETRQRATSGNPNAEDNPADETPENEKKPRVLRSRSQGGPGTKSAATTPVSSSKSRAAAGDTAQDAATRQTRSGISPATTGKLGGSARAKRGSAPPAAASASSTPTTTATEGSGSKQTSAKTGAANKQNGSIVVNVKRRGMHSKAGQIEGLSREHSDKAMQEADVLSRVQQLKAQGLWQDKKSSKRIEETRPKVHWDFVLEEMTWLSDVVQKEVKIKKVNAKRCAAMVQKHFRDKELAVARAERAREAQLRKIAANAAREVTKFWSNAQKLFEWRIRQKLEKKRKEALDQHLNYIVDKTEKYSNLLAESLAEVNSGQASRAESVCSGDTGANEGGDDIEYNPDSASSDDEETIQQEEEREKQDAGERQQELQELEEGAEVPLEDLLRKYYPDQFSEDKTKEKSVDSTDVREDIKKEEEKEIKKEEEQDVAVEEPADGRAKRRRKPIDFAAVQRKIDEENAKVKDEQEGDGTAKPESGKDKVETEDGTGSKALEKDDEDEPGIQALLDTSKDLPRVQNKDGKVSKSEEARDEEEDRLQEYANMAAKFQPTGNTLETTTVKTKVPSLLKHTLREYQHIGLDWLVSLYERSLNGILADEMGLGKTIQTIALMAHLAVDRANWGPHLIVVPTSVMLNWEMEIKKWCPGFKVLVYYGSQKERRQKRQGWTKPNAFHICITSYKLVIQDHSSFRRFKWQYFILDEAQHIKNFKSQRWQLLLNFATVGRLLLTGTPLQNNLMELWSLMHFLMPHVFESHRDFKEWFSNPLTGMVEGNNEYNDNLIRRLHKVLRPFLLRRLKNEVEKQLPKKYAHIVHCPLSKRQRFLYDDFMSRAKTRETLSSGNLLSVINVLMQLRKCCNHPNLFEPRPTVSPFVMPSVASTTEFPALVRNCLAYDPLNDILPVRGHQGLCGSVRTVSPLALLAHDLNVEKTGYLWFRSRSLQTSREQMLLMRPAVESSLAAPYRAGRVAQHLNVPGDGYERLRMRLKSHQPAIPRADNIYHSPVLHLQDSAIGPLIPTKHVSNSRQWLWLNNHKLRTPNGTYYQIAKRPRIEVLSSTDNVPSRQLDSEADAVNASATSDAKPAPTTDKSESSESLASPPPNKRAKLESEKLTSASAVQEAEEGDETAARKEIDVEEDGRAEVTRSGGVKRKLAGGSAVSSMPPPSSVGGRTSMITVRNAKGIYSLELFSLKNKTMTSPAFASSPSKLSKLRRRRQEAKAREQELAMPEISAKQQEYIRGRRERNHRYNAQKMECCPAYGSDLVEAAERLHLLPATILRRSLEQLTCLTTGRTTKSTHFVDEISCYHSSDPQISMIQTLPHVLERLQSVTDNFLVYVPSVLTDLRLPDAVSAALPTGRDCSAGLLELHRRREARLPLDLRRPELKMATATNHRHKSAGVDPTKAISLYDRLRSRFMIQTPDTRLIQYDCGKLQVLAKLLRKLHLEGHRVLIFTQMTKMLDVLEAFLNYHGYVYMRLDGSTKVEMRQALMERFNNNSKYFAFILSTRSGGVGINLTGADTVIFYDSDWNPTMDAQAQDRCHRIGQTRDVHIYRLISERTVEENILKKANQKRLLGDIAIEGGNFTTAFFKKQTIKDLFGVDQQKEKEADMEAETEPGSPKEGEEEGTSDSTQLKRSLEKALETAEDDSDRQAAKTARAEENQDEQEFTENPMDEDEVKFNSILSELSQVERFALRYLETVEEDWAKEQLNAADAEIAARKEEIDLGKLEELTQEIREELGEDETDSEPEDDVNESAANSAEVSSEEESDSEGENESSSSSNDDGDDETSSSDEKDELEEAVSKDVSETEDREGEADEEYCPGGSDDDQDDEATIDQDEKEEQKEMLASNNPDNEIEMLETEAELPIEQLLKLYYPDQVKEDDEVTADATDAGEPASELAVEAMDMEAINPSNENNLHEVTEGDGNAMGLQEDGTLEASVDAEVMAVQIESADVEDVSKLISEGATVTVADIGHENGSNSVIGRIVDETDLAQETQNEVPALVDNDSQQEAAAMDQDSQQEAAIDQDSPQENAVDQDSKQESTVDKE